MLYQIRQNGNIYELNVVGNQTWGGGMQTVVYEAPGTNGGVVMVTGRNTNSISLTGKLLVDREATFPLEDLDNKKNIFLQLKDSGVPVVLVSPITNNDTGVYIITEFSGNLVEGVSTYLPFTMTLTEHKQSNLQRTQQNLLSFEPGQAMRDRLRERNISIE